jgi:hypothetical protein
LGDPAEGEARAGGVGERGRRAARDRGVPGSGALLFLKEEGRAEGSKRRQRAEHEGSQKLALALSAVLSLLFLDKQPFVRFSISQENRSGERYALAFPIRTSVKRQRKRTTQAEQLADSRSSTRPYAPTPLDR